MQSPVMVECVQLGHRFRKTMALENLSFQVARGEAYGIVGPDGAGKTTTLRILAGLLRPTNGRFQVHTPRIGYMSQRFSLYQDLTVAENLAFVADLYGLPRSTWQPRAQTFLEWTGLAPFATRRAGRLSGGMKQKLALVAALLPEPELLLLDEPTTGVDPVARTDFWEILRSLQQQGLTLVVATPFLDEAERCQRVGLLVSGQLLAEGTPAQLVAQRTERLLTIAAPNLRPLRTQLQNHPAVLRTELVGEHLDIFIAHAEQEASLRSSILAISPTAAILPRSLTLEDAFALYLDDTTKAEASHVA